MSDETLAEVIRAVDAGKTEYAGVSANDFARIKEARQMISCGTMNHSVAIPKNAKNIDNAKAFLVFMVSDLGQSINRTADALSLTATMRRRIRVLRFPSIHRAF